MELLTAGAGKVGSLVLGDGAQYFAKRILLGAAPTGAEQDSKFDLPARAVLYDVLVDVKTPEVTGATKTLDVGLLSTQSGGNAQGLVAALSVTAAGVQRPGATVTTGTNETYFSATTRGALLAAFRAGTNVDGDSGLYLEKPHVAGAVTAKRVSFRAGSNDFVEFRGSIWLFYVVLP
jgi:hypothetical protein